MATRAARQAKRFVMGLAVAALIQTGRAEAAAPYWRCEQDRVTVMSNSSAERCETLLHATLRYEQVLAELVQSEADMTINPLRLYSLSRNDARKVMYTKEERHALRRSGIRSKYIPGARSNIATIVDVDGDEPLQSVLFLYGQSLLATGPMRKYPAWYRLGVANLLNGLTIRPDGSVLLNRNPQFAAVVRGSDRARRHFDLPALLEVEHVTNPADFNELARSSHAWAQFGLLTTDTRRGQYQELAVLMCEGTPAEEAVQTAFGSSLAELTEEFERGAWRKDVSYHIPAPETLPEVGSAIEMDKVTADAQLKTLKQDIQSGDF